MSVEDALNGALGAIAARQVTKFTSEKTEGTQTSAGAKLGRSSATVEASLQEHETQKDGVEQVPIGQSPEDLRWAAEQFKAANRQPVFEDFHHLSQGEQRRMAFTIKALGEWAVSCVVVGIWPNSHLLTYYNGELVGRIEDIHLAWTGDELGEVLTAGCQVLNVEIPASIRRHIVTDSYGGVGLLRWLTGEYLREAGIERASLLRRELPDEIAPYEAARKRVATAAGRFNTFVQRFPSVGFDGLRPAVYRTLLWVLVERMSPEQLMEGVSMEDLAHDAAFDDPEISVADLKMAVARLDDAQAEAGVHPAVFSFDVVSGHLALADRSFLLFRRYGADQWPWTQ